MTDKISDQSRFFTAELNETQRSISDAAKEAAKCCCDAQILALQNQAKTDAALAVITANQAADVRVSDAVATATLNAKVDILVVERGVRGNG
jgi:hypothetical protein